MIERSRIGMPKVAAVAAKGCGWNHVNRPPFVENGNGVRNFDGKVDVVRDEQNPLTRIGKLAQELQCLDSTLHIHAGRWLVCDDE